MKNNKFIKCLFLLVAIAIVVLIAFVIGMTGFRESDTLTVGFVMTGTTEEEGWNRLHYDGMKEACEAIDAELLVKENVSEEAEECEKAIRELAKEKADVIILSSYGYAAKVSNIVDEYPEIAFYSESFDHGNQKIKSYFTRMYQARYLSGIIAGMHTKKNRIGYVAAMANSEVNRGINAFTLGVQRVNPEAKVIVSWTESWDDSDREKELASGLIDTCGVDVITYHQNQQNVIEVAESKGIFSIGYHEAPKESSDNVLTAAEFHWGPTYQEILLDYIRGKSDTVDIYWLGIEQDAVGLTKYSPKVSEEAKEEIEQAKQEFLNGYDVFSGKIYDMENVLRCDEGERISDDTLLKSLNWYVKGVEFYED